MNDTKRKQGQPTKLTPERQADYIAAIEFGLSYDSACAEAGICTSTLANWRIWGAEGKVPYATFLAEERKALAVWERCRLTRMDEAGPNWTREAWKLERRMPENYSKRDKHELTGDVTVEHGGDALGQLCSAIARLAARGDEAESVSDPDGDAGG